MGGGALGKGRSVRRLCVPPLARTSRAIRALRSPSPAALGERSAVRRFCVPPPARHDRARRACPSHVPSTLCNCSCRDICDLPATRFSVSIARLLDRPPSNGRRLSCAVSACGLLLFFSIFTGRPAPCLSCCTFGPWTCAPHSRARRRRPWRTATARARSPRPVSSSDLNPPGRAYTLDMSHVSA